MTCYASFEKNKEHIAPWKLQFNQVTWLMEKNENKMYLKCISKALNCKAKDLKVSEGKTKGWL